MIRPAAEAANLETLRPVLESAMQQPLAGEVFFDEVESVLTNVKDSISGLSSQSYLIAESQAGIALGMLGMRVPNKTMRTFAVTANPAEIINAFVSSDQRGRGIGATLLRVMERMARNEGYNELVVNSGPRYRLSGWPFWSHMYGKPVALAEDYYGPHFHAAVWRKLLVEDAK